MKRMSLRFNGYYTDEHSYSISNVSGVYCVYRGTDQGKTVVLKQLLYVGESETVADRIIGHEKYLDWIRQVKAGETLIFSVGQVNGSDRARAKAALIYHHKPPLNSEYLQNFPFEDTEMQLTGQVAKLDTFFSIRRKFARKSASLVSIFATGEPVRSWR